MGTPIKLPWYIRLRGSKRSDRPKWRRIRKSDGESGVHSVQQQEQDLDHLGLLHDSVLHPEKE